MSRELDEALEYDALRNFAWSMGFFAQIHRNYDPCRRRADGSPGGCWYLQRSKKFQGEGAPHEPTILKYATADEVYAWLNEYSRSVAAERKQHHVE